MGKDFENWVEAHRVWAKWVGQKTESIALIASYNGTGVILADYGPGIEASIRSWSRPLEEYFAKRYSVSP